MPTSIARVKTISLFGNTCRVSIGDFLPDIPIEEGHQVTNPCENPFNQGIITCRSPDWNKFVDEVKGLRLDLPISNNDLQLPLYFPTLDLPQALLVNAINPDQFIGISLRHFTSSLVSYNAGGYREAKDIRFQPLARFQCFKDHPRMILFLTGIDTGIEYAWRERERFELVKNIKNRNILAVGAFNFSLFYGDCSAAQILNQKRSLLSAHYLQENGIPVIPHLYAITPFQLQRWIEWLMQNQGLKMVTINCQMSKSQRLREDDINVIKELIIAIPHLRVILEGFPFDSIHRFGPVIDNLHFTDKVPLQQTMNHKEILVDRIHWKKLKPSTEQFPDLLIKNIQRRLLQATLIRNYIYQSGVRSTG